MVLNSTRRKNLVLSEPIGSQQILVEMRTGSTGSLNSRYRWMHLLDGRLLMRMLDGRL